MLSLLGKTDVIIKLEYNLFKNYNKTLGIPSELQ